MFKSIIELIKINKVMKIKLNLILKGDPKDNSNLKLVNRFVSKDVEYLKITPHPYLTIDISPSSKEWDSNYTVNLNQLALFMMKRSLRKAIDNLHTEDLFAYIRGKLTLNHELADDLTVTFTVANKHISFQPVVITDNVENTEYEGLCFIINRVVYSCFITVDEAEFLYDFLNKLDLIALSLQMVGLMNIEDSDNQSATVVLDTHREIVEERPTEGVKTNFSTKKEPSPLPELD